MPKGLREWGRRLDTWRIAGIELWTVIERPEGRGGEFLLDHGVVVYPMNTKARARAHFRMSPSKSEGFEGRARAEVRRTDHPPLRPLPPRSEAAQELKLLTRAHKRLPQQQTWGLNQLTSTLKDYDPRGLELFGDLTTQVALDFLQTYPTPAAWTTLRPSGKSGVGRFRFAWHKSLRQAIWWVAFQWRTRSEWGKSD